MMKSVALILLIASVLLAGCSTAPPSAAAVPAETKSQEQASGEKNQGTEQDVLIVLEQSGGFAGVDESWRIVTDGRVTASEGKVGQVSSDALSAAVVELESLGFFELDSSYMPLDTCCDRFTYRLSVTAYGKTHTVTALEGAQEAPAEFWTAIEIVNTLLAEAGND